MKNRELDNVMNALFQYDEILMERLIKGSIEKGSNPLDTVEGLIEMMSDIGGRFESGELFLPDLMLAAKTLKVGMSLLEEEIKEKGLKKKSIGKIVIGTVYGDIHDIGKNIVATLLSANSFEVIDLGVNIRAQKFIEAVEIHEPAILAMSALLTTTAPEMERVIASIKVAGLNESVKIMVGGGSITDEFSKKIGADGYEPTAPLAVKLAKKLVKE